MRPGQSQASAVLLFFLAMSRQTIAVLAFALTACAVSEKSRMSDAATTPLSDLNLVHASIPAVLVDAQKRPYVAPADQSCTALAAEVRALEIGRASCRERVFITV